MSKPASLYQKKKKKEPMKINPILFLIGSLLFAILFGLFGIAFSYSVF